MALSHSFLNVEMDYKGQQLAELLYQLIIAISTVCVFWLRACVITNASRHWMKRA
jgi:hypothetical protein